MFLSSCTQPVDRRISLEDWEPIENEYARSYQILRKDEQRILISFGPAGRNDTAGIYLIGGSPVNDLQPIPQLTNVIVASTTQLPFFTSLGKEDLITGVVHLAEVFDRKIKQKASAGTIKEVGTADGMDQELIMSLRPQAIFDHPFGRNLRGTSSQIPVIHITEYLEQHPLGRAEWLKFFGTLLNAEEQAAALFDRIEERYRAVTITAARNDRRPAVFFASSWQGQWFAPPANSYMATLITDAAAIYALADQEAEGNITMDLETVLHKVRRSDHFGMILSSADSVTARVLAAGEDRLARIEAVNGGGFYGNSATTDLFGAAILEPDVVLTDLLNIFHPDTSTAEFRYFKPLLQPIRNATDPLRAPDTADRSPAGDAAHARRSSSRSHAR